MYVTNEFIPSLKVNQMANIESRGAGIRISLRKWNSQHIQASILRVLENEEFKNQLYFFRNIFNQIMVQKTPHMRFGISLKTKKSGK